VKGLDRIVYPKGVRSLFAVAGLCVLFSSGTRQAWAYIDPGTGGAIFSWLAPILGLIGIIFFATLRYSWAFVVVAAGFIRRHKRWTIPVAAVLALGLTAFLVATGEKESQGVPTISLAKPTESADSKPDTGRVAWNERLDNQEVMDLFSAAQAGRMRPAEKFRLFDDDECPDVTRCKYELNFRSRSCFFFDAPGSISKTITPLREAILVFYVAADFPQRGHSNDSVQFELFAETESTPARLLYASAWERRSPRHRQWTRVVCDLSGYAGGAVKLSFKVSMHRNDRRPGPAGVCLISDPRLASRQASSKTNVIVLSIETLRRDHLSLYGYERNTSPFLERLADESVVFEQSFSQSSWTRPSVASILTGLHVSQHGAITAFDSLDGSLVLLPEVLREHGYASAAFCSGYVVSNPIFNYDQGFDLFVNEELALFDELSQDALAWLDATPSRPFFVYMHSYDPHAPYIAPGRFTEHFDSEYEGRLKELLVLQPKTLNKMRDLSAKEKEYVIARYDAEILYTDTVLEKLVEGLKERGLWENTLLVVTSDHGEELGDHGSWGHGSGLLPEQLAVPFLIRFPGRKHAGTRSDSLASGVDVMPTVLGALGLPPPDGLPGIDLLESLDASGQSRRDYHYAELWKAPFFKGSPPTCRVVNSMYTLIRRPFQYVFNRQHTGARRKEELLFDLAADPGALDDLSASRPELRKEYAREIRERYMPGYMIAVAGHDGRAHSLSATVISEVPIEGFEKLATEDEDRVRLDDDRKTLRFTFRIRDDVDLLHFRTGPSPMPVAISVEIDGKPASADRVLLGSDSVRCEVLPLELPAARCPADAPPGSVPDYDNATEASLFIWRRGALQSPSAAQVKPEADMIDRLKDLGYL